MNKKLESKLFKRFRFLRPDSSLLNSLMSLGFECDDGWFGLIWNLCEDVEEILMKNNIDISYFDVFQIKETLGGLRFYYTFINDCNNKLYSEVDAVVDKYEKLSLKVCEKCGKPGKLRKNPILKTLCNECYLRINKNIGR